MDAEPVTDRRRFAHPLTVDLSVELGEAGNGGFTVSAAFEAAPGSTVAIVGPNGSGKSTLLSALVGTVPLRTGAIRLGDGFWAEAKSSLFVQPERRDIAYVAQDPLLFAHLSVADNVGFGLRYRHNADLSRRARRHLVAESLAQVGLRADADRRPDELSGGQQQRVAVARALVLAPAVLLLDEPLSKVDLDNRHLIRTSIRERRPDGQIQIVVTHGGDHARAADRVVALDMGKVVASGPPTTLAGTTKLRWLRDLLGSAD